MPRLATTREKLPLNSIREIMNMAANMPDVIQLQIGEPSAETPLHVRRAAVEAMEAGFTHYTSNAGLPSVREAMARRMKRVYDVDVSADRIVITPGAVTALNLALLATVEPGEEVLLPDPTYPNYDALVRLQGSVPVYYPTRPENGFVPNVGEMEALVGPFTKAIVVNSPSNPTGAVFPRETWQEILALAKRHDLFIISDEIYDDLIYDGEHVCPLALDPAAKDFVISIYGFSKSYAMTGWRLAYAVVPEAAFSVVCKLQEPITTCAASFTQKAGEAALDGPQDFIVQMREVYRQRRDMVCAILDRYGVHYNKPRGAFYVFTDVTPTGLSAKEFAIELLLNQHVAVAPCLGFGPSGKDFIRICFAGDEQQLREGVERIGQFYQSKSMLAGTAGAAAVDVVGV